jgi:hypothetical protein
VRNIKTVKTRGPTDRRVGRTMKERVRITSHVPEGKFMNKLIPLGTRSVRKERGGVLMTFNKVEITSHYSILGLYVRERLP